MSGFAGIISLDGAPPDSLLLQRMAQTLAFRGPDGTHITTKPGAGFCFTFLRTGPAPQCSSQPCSIDGRVWLLGDVRLDGRDDLRRKLEQHGDEIGPDATDEELVLRAWRRWQENGLPDLIGDYSFALWDAEARHQWCARDLMGAHPFFYAQVGNCLYFSNTLNAIRCAPDISSALDEYFIGDFLLQSWCPDPARTAFHKISRLPPGHLLRRERDRFEIRPFTSLPIEEPLWLEREEEYVERFRELLEQAVRERLLGGAVGILMSGGLDSTSVAAFAHKIHRERGIIDLLKAFTVDYRPLFEDEEGHFAAITSRFLGIPLDLLKGGMCEPFSAFDGQNTRTPEPCVEPFQALHLEQYRRISLHARVVLSGQGGDVVLTGRSGPYLAYLLKRMHLRTIWGSFGSYIVRERQFPPLRLGIRSRLHQWIGRLNGWSAYPPWLDREFETELKLSNRWNELQQAAISRHPLHPAAYASLTSAYWTSVAEGEDAAWTAVPIEARFPLLDLRLLRFLLRVPPVPWCMKKALLRRSVDRLLPEEIRSRPKTPLKDDPLLRHAEQHGWRPSLPDNFCGMIEAFVDCKRFKTTLDDAPNSSLWTCLSPIALFDWAQAIEKEQGIQ